MTFRITCVHIIVFFFSSTSIHLRYPSVLKCKQLPQCYVEIFAYAETTWQRQSTKLWARQIFETIIGSPKLEGTLQYNLLLSNLIIDVAVNEPMYISPSIHVSPTCAKTPKVRDVFRRWTNAKCQIHLACIQRIFDMNVVFVGNVLLIPWQFS